MESIKERMKKLAEFGENVFAVEFRGKLYYIIESGHLLGGERGSQKDYTLFDDISQLGHLYISDVKMTEAEIEFEKLDGVLVVPKEYFLLTDIEISDIDLRCKGLGSMLLNWATKDMQHASAKREEILPLLFIRHNSEETFAFYAKWGAVVNQKVEDVKRGSSCYMRIDKPIAKPEYEVKVIAKHDTTIKQDRSK